MKTYRQRTQTKVLPMQAYDHWKTLSPVRRDLMLALIRMLLHEKATPCFILSTAVADGFDWLKTQPEAPMIDDLLQRIEQHFKPLLNRIVTSAKQSDEALLALERVYQARPDLFATAKTHFSQIVSNQIGLFDALRTRFSGQSPDGIEIPEPELVGAETAAEDELDLSDVADFLESGGESGEAEFDFEILEEDLPTAMDDFSLEDSEEPPEPPPSPGPRAAATPPLTRAPAAPQAASGPPEVSAPPQKATPAKTISKAYERRTTVRYYQKMKVQASFPLTVSITAPDIKPAPISITSVLTQSGRVFEIDAHKPLVSIVPVIPGCRCVPERIEGDISAPEVHAEFFVTPTHTGKITQGRVDIIQNGALIDRIPLTTRIVSQRLTVWTLGLSLLTSLVGEVASGLGKGLATQLEQKFSVLNLLKSLLVDYHLYIAGAGLLIALILFLIMQPRQGDPVSDTLKFQTLQTET